MDSQSSQKENPEHINYQEIEIEEEESNIESMINDIKESKQQLAYIDDNDYEKLKQINDNIRIKEHLLYMTMVEEGLIPKSTENEMDAFSEEYLDYYNFGKNQQYSECFKDASNLLKKSKNN